jgi:hypothetical protein
MESYFISFDTKFTVDDCLHSVSDACQSIELILEFDRSKYGEPESIANELNSP